jgi:transposase
VLPQPGVAGGQEATEVQLSRHSNNPETQALIKVYGVGQLTALTYVLTLGSKERFQRSRDVGCYLGLRPRRSQSGARDPQLGITKAGNVYLRTAIEMHFVDVDSQPV